MDDLFDLSHRVVVITGGAGFLGRRHAEAVARFGGIPVLLDLDPVSIDEAVQAIRSNFSGEAWGYRTDVTRESEVAQAANAIVQRFGRIDVLINNAANNPAVGANGQVANSPRLEDFSLETWHEDLAVGLTGAFLCAKHFGSVMAAHGKGSIINISSDLGLIGPDQSLYRQEGVSEEKQNVKPVTYSVVKTALLGLTRYLATYWGHKDVRCNALCPGGVLRDQGDDFLSRISRLIPMGRMAGADELQGAIVFLASDASSYMTGAVLSVDGGRTCW